MLRRSVRDRGAVADPDAFVESPQVVLVTEFQARRSTMLGKLLADHSLVEDSAIEAILWSQPEERIGQELVKAGLLTELQVTEALAEQFGTVAVDLTRVVLDKEAAEQLPADRARALNSLPIGQMADGTVVVAIADPTNTAALIEVAEAIGRPVEFVLAHPHTLEPALESLYSAFGQTATVVEAFGLIEDGAEERLSASAPVDDNAPAVQIVNLMLAEGIRLRASDIHIEPQAEDLRVRFRVDGTLLDSKRFPANIAGPVISRIKVLADMNIIERRRPQDGQFTFQVDDATIDVRVATTLTIHGERVALRLLETSRTLLTLNELGMPHDLAVTFERLVRSPLGMLLCSGPTGSGKTTTLYSALGLLNDSGRNLMTIEDPVEYVMPGVNQHQINEAAEITFAAGLKALLRQDPDVILVGEIRDSETARIAVQSALTGHFVLSSLHAVDSTAALHRLLDMGLEPFLISTAVSGVVGQRLIRQICTHCATTYTPPAEHREIFERVTGTTKGEWIQGTGCNLCSGTGFRGRIGVYEVMVATPRMKTLIGQRASHEELRGTAISQGMKPMFAQAMSLVNESVTTVGEALRTIALEFGDEHDTD